MPEQGLFGLLQPFPCGSPARELWPRAVPAAPGRRARSRQAAQRLQQQQKTQKPATARRLPWLCGDGGAQQHPASEQAGGAPSIAELEEPRRHRACEKMQNLTHTSRAAPRRKSAASRANSSASEGLSLISHRDEAPPARPAAVPLPGPTPQKHVAPRSRCRHTSVPGTGAGSARCGAGTAAASVCLELQCRG